MEELEKTNIRNLLLVALLLMLCGGIYFSFLHFSIQMKNESIRKADCLESDYLRVQIGGRYFAFPRKNVFLIEGKNIPNITNTPNIHTSSGADVCQKKSDPALRFDAINLNIIPVSCDTKVDCHGKEIMVELVPLNRISDPDRAIARYRDELNTRCILPDSPHSKWHARYGNTCRMSFYDTEIYYWMQFRNVSYPKKEINSTIQLVVLYVEQFEITIEDAETSIMEK